MKAIKLSDKRLLLTFPTRKEMNLSFFRITEFSEGKVGIKGQHFTADVFIDRYTDKKGSFKPIDYFSFWEGHNVSVKTLNEFIGKFTNELSAREKAIMVESFDIDDDGYIIAAQEGDKMTIKHETAHGLYFENEVYRNYARTIIMAIPTKTFRKYRDALFAMDYNKDNMFDEMQAYCVAYCYKEWKECFGKIKLKEIKRYRDALGELFDKHSRSNS